MRERDRERYPKGQVLTSANESISVPETRSTFRQQHITATSSTASEALGNGGPAITMIFTMTLLYNHLAEALILSD